MYNVRVPFLKVHMQGKGERDWSLSTEKMWGRGGRRKWREGRGHKTFSVLQGGFQGIQGNKELIGDSINSNRLRHLVNKIFDKL